MAPAAPLSQTILDTKPNSATRGGPLPRFMPFTDKSSEEGTESRTLSGGTDLFGEVTNEGYAIRRSGDN